MMTYDNVVTMLGVLSAADSKAVEDGKRFLRLMSKEGGSDKWYARTENRDFLEIYATEKSFVIYNKDEKTVMTEIPLDSMEWVSFTGENEDSLTIRHTLGDTTIPLRPL